MLKRYMLWAGSVCAALIPLLASADSLVLIYPTNGHKYQRIDIEDQSWTVARDNCKARGGYLATITTLGENGFIKDYLLKGHSYWESFYLGGSSTKQQGVWEWATTTEKFSYTNWASGEPNPANGQYLFMNAEYGKWYSSSDSNYGYICEWGGAAYKDFIATAAVGDMNSNGSPELATLFMDQATGKNVVQVRDSASGTIISTAYFGTATKQFAMSLTVLPDINGNAAPELSVLLIDNVTLKGTQETRDALTGVLISKLAL